MTSNFRLHTFKSLDRMSVDFRSEQHRAIVVTCRRNVPSFSAITPLGRRSSASRRADGAVAARRLPMGGIALHGNFRVDAFTWTSYPYVLCLGATGIPRNRSGRSYKPNVILSRKRIVHFQMIAEPFRAGFGCKLGNPGASLASTRLLSAARDLHWLFRAACVALGLGRRTDVQVRFCRAGESSEPSPRGDSPNTWREPAP